MTKTQDQAPVNATRLGPGFSGPADIGVMAAELAGFLERVRQSRLREAELFRPVPPELLELKEVALSGHCEPTLCLNITEVVEAVVHLRARQLHPFKIVLMTNTSGLGTPEVQRGLRQLTMSDEVWVKLDAGTQDYMERIYHPDITLEKVLDNILALGRKRLVIVQGLFPQIATEEPSDQEIDQYAQRLLGLKTAGANISMVQIYSSHRSPHRPGCAHLPLGSLSYVSPAIYSMRILFFTHLKDVTHCAEMHLAGADMDADGLWCKLIETHPGLERFRASVRLAKNSEYVGHDARFTDADEVALIPPVSGG